VRRFGWFPPLLLAVAFCVGPFAWQLLTSVRPEAELTEAGLPSTLTWASYAGAFHGRPFGRVLWNSFLVASLTTSLCLVVGTTAAFALAKLRFPGRRLLLAATLATSMFPPIATVSPLFLVIRALGLRDQLAGLVLPYTTFALPLTIWILSGFFRAIPDDLYRAALLDGCSPFQAFRRVLLPVVVPGLGATAILVFVAAYNELIYALTFTSSPEQRTVPVAIRLFAAEHKEPWGEIAAASMIASVPLLLVTLLCQRHIVRGLTAGGVKG
jgi:multiple sugar transport system permease protein